MVKIALDIMGGDNAPQSNINGAIDFLKENQDSVKIYMVGDEKYILPELEKNKNISNDTFEIIHASQIITSALLSKIYLDSIFPIKLLNSLSIRL